MALVLYPTKFYFFVLKIPFVFPLKFWTRIENEPSLGDTDGFFESYLKQPSDTEASLFKKSASEFLSSVTNVVPQIAIFPLKYSRENSEDSILSTITKSLTQSNVLWHMMMKDT